MHNPNILRERARRCRALLKSAVDPEVVEQLRVWAVELADEAEAVQRRVPKAQKSSHLRRRPKLRFGRGLPQGKEA